MNTRTFFPAKSASPTTLALVASVACSASVTSWAQSHRAAEAPSDPILEAGRPTTVARLLSEYVAPSDLGDGGSKASFYQVGLQSQIPFPIAGALTGTVGLGIETRGYDFSDFGQFMTGLDSPIDQSLASRIAPGLSYRLNDRWRMFTAVSWLYTGAVGTAVQDASMWGGNIGAFYQVNTNLTLALGITATERIGFSALVVPLIGFNWKVNDRWTLIGGDVANAINGPTLGLQASYRLDDRWSLFGIGAFVSTFTRFDDDSSIASGSLRYRSAAALAGAEYAVSEHWTVRLWTGARLAQQYSFLDADGNSLAEDTTGTSPTVGLTIRASF